MSDSKWLVYLVRCSDKSLYCGISNDFKNRLIEHNSGKGAKYTRSRRPVELVGISPEMTKSEALKLEHRIKQLRAGKKITELTWEENEMTTGKELRALAKEIKILEKKIKQLITTIEKKDPAKVAKKSTSKFAKAKITKKAPAKRVPAKMKTAQLSATDQVLKILKGRKRGVNAAALMEKTGFDNKKIQNILHRTYKQGKIKRVGKGIYAGA